MNREDLIDVLRFMQHNSVAHAKEANAYPIWQKSVDVIEEVLDIMEDYDKLAEQAGILLEKFTIPKHPYKKGDNFYVCQTCNRKVMLRNNYCQHCGQMLRAPKDR